MKIDFVSRYKIFVTISLVIILVGLAITIFQGLNLGIDFKGGTVIYVNIGKPYSPDDIRSILSSQGIQATVVQVGEDKQDALIRMRYMENQSEIQKKLIEALKEKYNLSDERFSVDTVGPTIGRDLTRNAILATVISWVFILIYVAIRFEFRSGVAAIVALVHDVLIMVAAAAILRTQINSPFVAAVLTIIGYSINDTIVIFDRVRENQKKYGRSLSWAEIVNKSINESMTRTINTSLTTFLTVTALYVFGVESIKEFSLPILVGIISGTYSTIFIAGPLWVEWNERSERRRVAAAK
ncbi:preprotein translocase subunit SecF [Caldicoprobacter guelmensis]|uniref:protein translocase subunit SecF n=1 Tax=Caldicoprobacter guelmensis TaxID=1170224 RepID=UPI00195ED915|nr:protein translocase subunit SecF [Caldicoprobacter guelmensis]MBM7582301.1 preprotein translocase subunit SecF [Caldicoprobacter guelmensis]